MTAAMPARAGASADPRPDFSAGFSRENREKKMLSGRHADEAEVPPSSQSVAAIATGPESETAAPPSSSASASAEQPNDLLRKRLGDPTLRKELEAFVRRRVGASDVDDVVQTVLVEALAAGRCPTEPKELVRYLVGMARHKSADVHRRGSRNADSDEGVDLAADPDPVEERELVRWAEAQVASMKGADQTLDWMAREGEGEKLESIAAEAKIPAATVRQRVSRMRRWMKDRWKAELALVAAVGIVIFFLWRAQTPKPEQPIALPPENPVPHPTATATTDPPPDRLALERATKLRVDGLAACDRDELEQCRRALDAAKEIDPAGESRPEVQAARKKLQENLDKAREEERLKTSPTTSPTSSPTTSLSPTAVPLRTPPTKKPSPKNFTKDGSSFDSDFDSQKEAPSKKGGK